MPLYILMVWCFSKHTDRFTCTSHANKAIVAERDAWTGRFCGSVTFLSVIMQMERQNLCSTGCVSSLLCMWQVFVASSRCSVLLRGRTEKPRGRVIVGVTVERGLVPTNHDSLQTISSRDTRSTEQKADLFTVCLHPLCTYLQRSSTWVPSPNSSFAYVCSLFIYVVC
jgi:hypothetical protein